MRRWLVLVPVAAMVLVASPAQASPARFASNGEACTMVGTSKADVLTGTGKHDVICGLGGNDTIRGAGGDDVLDGGGGRDTINGDKGNDRLYGGGDNDSETGGSGRDLLSGGAGGDVLLGGGDGDVLRGQAGNDDLNGEAGSDNLDGGDGTNWCTVGSGDVQSRCVYDREAPVVHEMIANPSTVDVSAKDQPFTLRVHVTDDTGVAWVSHYTDAGQSGGPKLLSGDVRDGWWEVKGIVRRYSKPGVWGMVASAGDRIGRQSWRAEPTGFTVLDRNPDLTAPVVTSFSMSRTAVDVRTGDAKVTITANVTDDRSGTDDLELALMTPPNSYNQAPVQDRLVRVSGTDREGKYRTEVTIPRGSTGGLWNVQLLAVDRGGNVARYLGPDMYALKQGETYNNYVPLPSGGGRLDVTGTAVDTDPPVLQDVVVDRTVIDTLPHGVNVNFDVAASDLGDGIRQVTVSVLNYSTSDWLELQGQAYQPSGGTANSGVWHVTVTFPQGTAPGTYWLGSVSLWDRTNSGYYSSPVSYDAMRGTLLAPEHYRTADGANWDGTITVIDNPAG